MPVNLIMTTVSDWAFTSTIGIYMLAAMLFATEYALERYPIRRRAAAPRLVAVGSAATPLLSADQKTTATSDGFSYRCGCAGVSLTVLGAAIHLVSVLLRGLSSHRVPWGNMYEYLSALCLVAVLAWLYILRCYSLRRISVFFLLPIALLLFIAGNYLYVEAAALQPALRSYWIAIHVAAAILASGVFLLSGVISALHLITTAEPAPTRRARPKGSASRLPEPELLDKVAYRTGVFGFFTLTFAIITGAIWAESAWGRYWGWDPKETIAFVSWVCYAAYLHARSTSGWRVHNAAWVNVVGMVIVLFNLFFINLVAVGMHSYSGLR